MNEALFRLRTLIDFQADYSYFVGYCLETGTVVTADDCATAQSMLEEILCDELQRGIEHQDLQCFDTPAPFHIWQQWKQQPLSENVKLFDITSRMKGVQPEKAELRIRRYGKQSDTSVEKGK